MLFGVAPREVALPAAGLSIRRDLDGGHLVFRTVGGPVGVVGGHHVGAGGREVEGGIDDARLHALGKQGAQPRFSGPAGDADPVAIGDAAVFGVNRMNLQAVLVMPGRVRGAPGLGADVVLAEDAAGGQDQRETAGRLLGGWDVGGDEEAAQAAGKCFGVHDRRAAGRRLVARPLQAAELLEFVVTDAVEAGGEGGDLVHDFGWMSVVHRDAQGIGQGLGRLPVGLAAERLHDLADPRDAALGIGEGAILFEEGGAGQEDMGELRRLVEENVLHDQAFELAQCGLDVPGVGVGLGDVLALHVHALVGAGQRGVEHVGDAVARFRVEGDAPVLLEQGAGGGVGHRPVARQLVREGAHVAGTLDVVLAAQRIDADAGAADVAGGHGEVGDGHDRRRSLAVLGDAEAVIDRAVAGRGVEAGGGADVGGGHAGDAGDRLRAVFRLQDEGPPGREVFACAAAGDEFLIDQPFADHDVGQRVEHGDVAARLERQMMRRGDVRRAHEVDGARIDHHQLGAFADAALEQRAEHRMAVGRIGADDDDHVGRQDRSEILGAGRLAERLLEAVAGR